MENKKRKTKKPKQTETPDEVIDKILESLENLSNKLNSAEQKSSRLLYYKFHKFLSLSKTKSIPYKEWIGETVNDEIVVVNYIDGILKIGAGYNEIKARSNMDNVGTTQVNGQIRFDPSLTLDDINKQLKLEWVFPDGYFEE